jgi:hypothetical protein
MFTLYNIVSRIIYFVVVCADFLGTHMASLVFFGKLGVTHCFSTSCLLDL